MATVPSIGRAAPPEAEATHALYERYAAQVFRYCLHQLGSREEAEDAVQSTFLNAFRGLKRGIVPELESAWLFKIAQNVCLSRRRSTWRRGRIESPADFELVEELAPAQSRRADELIGLQDVLEGMPEQQRRAILLREWQGLSYREIAEELELSQAAVETLIFRARRSLAAGLEQPAAPARRRRSAPAAALGNVLSAAQSWLFGGGAAVKVAATVAAVGAGTVVATAPVQQHRHPAGPAARTTAPAHHVRHTAPRRAAAAPAVEQVAPAPTPESVRAAPAVVRHASPAKHRAKPAHARHVVPVVPAPVETVPVQTEPAPVVPPVEHGRSNEQHGRATAPGQLKKQQPPAATVPPATAPPATDPPVEPAPAGAPVDTSPVEPAAPADDAEGNGHGNAYGHDKPHGKSDG